MPASIAGIFGLRRKNRLKRWCVGDRHRHEPLRDRGSLDFLGRTLLQERQERQKTPLQAHEERRALAKGWLKATSRPMRLGGYAHQAKLPPAQFLRLRSRRGAKKAIDAVAASMLTAIYHMLKNGTYTWVTP